MIKKIIENLKKRRFDSTTEKYYIERIAFLQKDCWKANMNQKGIFGEICRYLNKLKLSQERHPFLITLRKDINALMREDVFDREEADRIFNSLYEYRELLTKKEA